MSIKIVSDSSANLIGQSSIRVRLSMKPAAGGESISVCSNAIPYASAPLTIVAENADKYYRDDESLNVHAMLSELASITCPTKTACPGPGDWLEAFGDADEIIVISLTGALSGACNSARNAAAIYTEDHPNARIHVFDSLSTGPELELLIEKCADWIANEFSFDDIVNLLAAYSTHTHLAFSLESLQNFANNGRVNPALAKLVKMMHVRIVGRASAAGELEAQHKCPGRKKALSQLFENMLQEGYAGGKVRIRHTENPEMAEALKSMILEQFPQSDVTISENAGLCAFYTERGGLLAGYECR